jgi:hypothetical protein
MGRPSLFPFCRAQARPARTRSFRISRSNSAKIASKPAIARPSRVVKSSASVNETKPTPGCSSSCSVASRSVTDRPQRVQPPHQDDIDLPATCGLQQLFAGLPSRRAGANLTNLHDYCPAAPGGILAHGAILHRQRLLVVCGNTGIQANSQHFWLFPLLAKNLILFRLVRCPSCGHFNNAPDDGCSLPFSAIVDSLRRSRRHLRQCVPVVPRHPLSRMRRYFGPMPLQLCQVVKELAALSSHVWIRLI